MPNRCAPGPCAVNLTILAHFPRLTELRSHLVLGDDLLLFGGGREPGSRYRWTGMRLAEIPGRFGRRVVIRYSPCGGGPEVAFMIGSVPEDSAATLDTLWRWHAPCTAERRWRQTVSRDPAGRGDGGTVPA